jgi:hypothetical protein
VLGNKCAGQHNLKRVHFKATLASGNFLAWSSAGYTHKMSGFKTSGFKTSGFKTSETSGLQNVRFTNCQVYKTSGLQDVWLQKNVHKYSVLVVGGNPQVMLQPCLQVK